MKTTNWHQFSNPISLLQVCYLWTDSSALPTSHFQPWLRVLCVNPKEAHLPSWSSSVAQFSNSPSPLTPGSPTKPCLTLALPTCFIMPLPFSFYSCLQPLPVRPQPSHKETPMLPSPSCRFGITNLPAYNPLALSMCGTVPLTLMITAFSLENDTEKKG